MCSVPLSSIPLDLRRLAAQLVEDTRDNERMPNWSQAQLGAEVQPLYRPDVDGVAYYEIPVVTGPSGAEPAGYIIVSTRKHDFPITNWNNGGESPCEKLRWRAEKAGDKAVKFFKLDSLAYAAENDAHELVATSDVQPLGIKGLSPAALDDDSPPIEETWKTFPEAEDDSMADKVDGELVVSGPEPPEDFELVGWESWDALKANYARDCALQIESARRQASRDWEIQERTEQSGEDLVAGYVYRVACLYPLVDYKLIGSGADFAAVGLVQRDQAPPALEIKVLDSPPKQAAPLEVVLDYPEKKISESVKFWVLPSETRTAGVRWGPEVGPWRAWTEYWAGTDDDQRWYDQIPEGTPPNNSDCASGCGATAWAMLFGWVDVQASQDRYRWRGHWGIYRANGGKGTTDADAPDTMDSGVRNMIWEIHQHMDSWCVGNTGQCATWPRDMNKAHKYLHGRSTAGLKVRRKAPMCGNDELRKNAKAVIEVTEDAVVIGSPAGFHYPLAYGYRVRKRRIDYKIREDEWEYQHQFYVNQGWGSSADCQWVTGFPWLVGHIYP
jgi:hypothetical protein